MPKVSVLMPVYNGEKYLREAIDSILNQTFSDFEFLIINDGSTDNSVKIIESYKDSRIRLVHNKTNLGLAETCNKGLELAQGEYVARMDSDDISLPRRLEKQVKYMDSRPKIGISGAWAKIIGENQDYIIKKPCEPREVKTSLIFNTCFIHPSVIIRKKIIDNSKMKFKKEFDPGDDYVFWAEISQYTEFANLPEVELLYRLHPKNISKLKSGDQIKGARQARLNLIRKLNIEPTEAELIIHSWIRKPTNLNYEKFFSQTETWLKKLIQANEQEKYYDEKIFNYLISKRWLDVCYGNASAGLTALKTFYKSSLNRNLKLKSELIILIKFFIKSCFKYQ